MWYLFSSVINSFKQVQQFNKKKFKQIYIPIEQFVCLMKLVCWTIVWQTTLVVYKYQQCLHPLFKLHTNKGRRIQTRTHTHMHTVLFNLFLYTKTKLGVRVLTWFSDWKWRPNENGMNTFHSLTIKRANKYEEMKQVPETTGISTTTIITAEKI